MKKNHNQAEELERKLFGSNVTANNVLNQGEEREAQESLDREVVTEDACYLTHKNLPGKGEREGKDRRRIILV